MIRRLRTFWQSFYLTPRFFWVGAGVILVFIISYFLPALEIVADICLLAFVLTVVVDAVALYALPNGITASRLIPEKFSNGENNEVELKIENRYRFPITIHITDELPFQFQKRDFRLHSHFAKPDVKRINYFLRPVERGAYVFGALHVFVRTIVGLTERRYSSDQSAEVAVYPSFMEMRRFEFLAMSNRLSETGIKKLRRIGDSSEFEQIREYVAGDDYRKINWKATARKSYLMVNNFQDERSQQIYCVVDKGRIMQMPFNGITLLDYAINTSLVMSNIALLRQDRIGLLTFSNTIDTFIKADRRGQQMYQIVESLYRQATDFKESDYERLYVFVREEIRQRSLLIFFTNFDSVSSLRRNLKYLKRMASRHLVVVVFFENAELFDLEHRRPDNIEAIYLQTIAQKFILEKRQIVKELQNAGVHSVLCPPEDLSVNTINKYLELKSRGLI